MQYNFTIVLSPSTVLGEYKGQIFIDPKAQYGYWERRDGSEGGGLWFDGITLVDFDGAYELPKKVIEAMQTAGFDVE